MLKSLLVFCIFPIVIGFTVQHPSYMEALVKIYAKNAYKAVNKTRDNVFELKFEVTEVGPERNTTSDYNKYDRLLEVNITTDNLDFQRLCRQRTGDDYYDLDFDYKNNTVISQIVCLVKIPEKSMEIPGPLLALCSVTLPMIVLFILCQYHCKTMVLPDEVVAPNEAVEPDQAFGPNQAVSYNPQQQRITFLD